MERLRIEIYMYLCVLILKNIISDFKIVYYNIRFFYLYIRDLVYESNMYVSDIIVIFESRLK